MNYARVPDAHVIEQIKQESIRFSGITLEVGKVIIGHTDLVQMIMMAILCDGHLLLEGVPGVAKTTMIKAITRALGLSFNRIQFTPDLLPSDVIGTLIYNPKTQEFETKKGPIFANLILADEINRAPAKVQAALLEAMAERQVTIGSQTYHLQAPFLVFATQNPLEQEGTYRLPEAQVDRFMCKLFVDYPTVAQEREIVRRSLDMQEVQPILSREDILRAQQLAAAVYVDDKIVEYILSMVFATRVPAQYHLENIAQYIQYGVSPRATLALYHGAKAYAFLQKRHFVTPDDVKKIAFPILRHRLVLTYQADADQISADTIINKILHAIHAP